MRTPGAMPTVLVLGSGMVVAPLVDYLLDACRWRVVLTDPAAENASRIIRGRTGGSAVAWSAGDDPLLQRLVQRADVVVSMLPPALHLEVARACLLQHRHLVTTSYIGNQMAALDQQVRAEDLLFLNEVGESPGLDHMSLLRLLAHARAAGEEIRSVHSYAGGLPAPDSNTNPWGYKLSWSPRGVFLAAQSPATYLEAGTRIEMAPGEVFDHCRTVSIEGVGTFETYPNRDATRYLEPYGLPHETTLYRGLLRNEGWCATMRAIHRIGLLDPTAIHRFDGMTYRGFLATLRGCEQEDLRPSIARCLGCDPADPVVERLAWLGLFDASPIPLRQGTALDVLVDRATSALAYAPGERDMVVIHNEVVSCSPLAARRRTATLVEKGMPDGHSAMARAVGLTAGICVKLLVEGAFTVRGVHGPFLPEIYDSVLDEMARWGFCFVVRESTIDSPP